MNIILYAAVCRPKQNFTRCTCGASPLLNNSRTERYRFQSMRVLPSAVTLSRHLDQGFTLIFSLKANYSNFIETGISVCPIRRLNAFTDVIWHSLSFLLFLLLWYITYFNMSDGLELLRSALFPVVLSALTFLVMSASCCMVFTTSASFPLRSQKTYWCCLLFTFLLSGVCIILRYCKSYFDISF